MSKQPVRGVDVENLAPAVNGKPDGDVPGHGPSEAQIADYLQSNADFFERHATLLTKLKLIDVARSNDALAAKIHRLACRLVRARNASTLLDSMETSLREDFGASEWLLLLAPTRATGFANIESRHLRLIEPTAAELKMFDTLFESARPRCGQIRDSQRDFLFGAGTIEIGSAALVPLGRELGFGLLAIGSPDAQRFHPTMSTDFLARIGDLVTEAVAAA
jgi:uncharacterized protein YigA (DUF484 family)